MKLLIIGWYHLIHPIISAKKELEKYIKMGSKEVYYLRMLGDKDIHFL